MAVPKQWIMGDAFTIKAKHHQSMEALWTSKWRFPCSLSVYPFHDGKVEDFDKVFDQLIKDGTNDAYSDAYTETFFPVCDELMKKATAATAAEQYTEASALYLRVACLYRISRFPGLNTATRRRAWEAQKAAYMMASAHWAEPVREVNIPHEYHAGADGDIIPAYIRLPATASRDKPVPTILLITGLDGHRPDNTERTNEFLKRGWGCVIIEIPGTGDCPAERRDPKSPDRLWDSVFAWMQSQTVFEMNKVVVWGLSMGGYYAIRIAHTHHDKLAGCVAQGAGCHLCFSPEWLQHIDLHEYPFKLTPALTHKFGYSSVEEFKANSQKDFSLIESGIVKGASCRLLLVNGTADGLVPIEDSMLMMEYGRPKEARFYSNMLHMGYPPANESIYPWLEAIMSS